MAIDARQAAILGAVQGVLEWLPVSSEGQSMLLMLKYLSISVSEAFSLAIFLHLGTMFAVLLRFRREFLHMVLNPTAKLSKLVILATLSTGVTAVPLFFFVKNFKSGDMVSLLIGLMLIATGLLLRAAKTAYGRKKAEDLSGKEAFFLGLFQGLAILPGVSRSGTTITYLLLSGVEQGQALIVSFLISVPAVLGAVTLEALSGNFVFFQNGLVMLLTSFAMGYLTMDALLKLAKKVNFSIFCVFLGVVTIIIVAPAFGL
ncbi:MAG: hypothetical protein DRN91_00705 [Candidatus Alkanophagales archaeon]|nr:MAG: hypothetical protein DRN91_00705 [Candidatus Alkanophagales archaeon]